MPLRRHNWDYGTRAERRQRLEYAIRLLRETFQKFEHYAPAESGGASERQKELDRDFGPDVDTRKRRRPHKNLTVLHNAGRESGQPDVGMPDNRLDRDRRGPEDGE